MPWRQFVAAGVYWTIYAVRLRRIDWGPSIFTEFPYNWPFTTGHYGIPGFGTLGITPCAICFVGSFEHPAAWSLWWWGDSAQSQKGRRHRVIFSKHASGQFWSTTARFAIRSRRKSPAGGWFWILPMAGRPGGIPDRRSFREIPRRVCSSEPSGAIRGTVRCHRPIAGFR